MNKTNNYGYDPEEQRTETFTGMGLDINVHDQWAVESPGAIYDRTKEHLGSTDKGIITFRKLLVKAINGLSHGEPAPFTLRENEAGKFRGPMTIDTTAPLKNWQEDWKIQNKKKRKHSEWTVGTAI